jgi:4-hydroxy-4-methyl-2-oxoglutarate aldolase
MLVESCPARVLAPQAAADVLARALASDAAEPVLLARIASGEPLDSVLAT